MWKKSPSHFRSRENRRRRTRNIRVDMRIQVQFQEYIRSDSAAVLITEGLLGNRFVEIDRGFVGRRLGNEDEIPGREEKALKEVVERSADLMTNLNSITQQASAVLDDVRKGRGSLGKFLVGRRRLPASEQLAGEPR